MAAAPVTTAWAMMGVSRTARGIHERRWASPRRGCARWTAQEHQPRTGKGRPYVPESLAWRDPKDESRRGATGPGSTLPVVIVRREVGGPVPPPAIATGRFRVSDASRSTRGSSRCPWKSPAAACPATSVRRLGGVYTHPERRPSPGLAGIRMRLLGVRHRSSLACGRCGRSVRNRGTQPRPNLSAAMD
jgi:hypothetical protein